MKLISKEICPVTVRDRLIKNLAGQDVALCDLVKAVEWAEEKCLELNEENISLKHHAAISGDLVYGLEKEIEVYKKTINKFEKYIRDHDQI